MRTISIHDDYEFSRLQGEYDKSDDSETAEIDEGYLQECAREAREEMWW